MDIVQSRHRVGSTTTVRRVGRAACPAVGHAPIGIQANHQRALPSWRQGRSCGNSFSRHRCQSQPPVCLWGHFPLRHSRVFTDSLGCCLMPPQVEYTQRHDAADQGGAARASEMLGAGRQKDGRPAWNGCRRVRVHCCRCLCWRLLTARTARGGKCWLCL